MAPAALVGSAAPPARYCQWDERRKLLVRRRTTPIERACQRGESGCRACLGYISRKLRDGPARRRFLGSIRFNGRPAGSQTPRSDCRQRCALGSFRRVPVHHQIEQIGIARHRPPVLRMRPVRAPEQAIGRTINQLFDQRQHVREGNLRGGAGRKLNPATRPESARPTVHADNGHQRA